MNEAAPSSRLPDIEAALRLFDETTTALSARIRRLEDVLTIKQQELVASNAALSDKVAELDRLSSYLNLVMGAVASGVVVVDRDGIITTCNAAASAALAGVFPRPIGADYRAAFPDSPLLAVLSNDHAVAAYERAIVSKDGARRVIAGKASPLRNGRNELLGAVEVFEDVTEVRRMQETIERADRLKQLGEMAAGVAHEIRNPLNGIEGFASLLSRDLPVADPRHRFAAAIIEGVRNLNRTVSGLLEFTKPRQLDRRLILPLDVAESCLDLVRAGQQVRQERDPSLPSCALCLVNEWNGTPVNIDSSQLRQVLLNLVQNAVQAVEELETGGRVELRVAARKDALDRSGVAFLVDDNGPGVPIDDRQRIFTPFYTTKEQGTGLGLAVSYTTVGLHGGNLTVEDSPLGGARFVVWLPV
jgi:signal transduction histidine kinase